MEDKQVHSTIKCKSCGQVKNRYYMGRYPSGKDSRYVDETGREWNGHVCGLCHKKAVNLRKQHNAAIKKIQKESSNDSGSNQ